MVGRIVGCNNDPTAGALVFIPGQSFLAMTDVNGYFVLNYVPPSGTPYDLGVVAPGQAAKIFPAVINAVAQQTVQLTDIAVCVNPAAVCGNGITEAGEQCDDGNAVDGDFCTKACTVARCGDGIVQQGVEACDHGAMNGQDPTCTSTCTIVTCGDGIVSPGAGEQCDDGNNFNGDGCSNTCRFEQQATCSDQIQNQGETDKDCGGPNCARCSDGLKCVSGGDCTSGVCTGGVCQAVALLTQGSACSAPNQCQTGFCADGFCADSACTGACMSASAAFTAAPNGTCAPIKAGTDPGDECQASGSGVCAAPGVCNGAGACVGFAPPTTTCAAPSCSNGVMNQGGNCNGLGTCSQTSPVSCLTYTCNTAGTACNTSCTNDSQCSFGNFCNASGACVAKKTLGAACLAGNECSNNICVDGFCSDSICNGICQSTSAAIKGFGANGTCGNIAAGRPDNNPVCDGGNACNGAGSCLLAAGQSCSSPNQCASGICFGFPVFQCQ